MRSGALTSSRSEILKPEQYRRDAGVARHLCAQRVVRVDRTPARSSVRKLTGRSGLNVGVYGVSWGAFLALHLEAATGRMRPTVSRIHARREEVSDVVRDQQDLGIELAAYIHFSNSRAKYTGAELAYLTCPWPAVRRDRQPRRCELDRTWAR